ncbi:MAG: DUF945 domain-containing protein [Loktanella sp.]|nr:DUF945 domain-containing protein [Loktanella sp.]
MKNGKTIVELAQEIERQNSAKADFIATTNSLMADPGEAGGLLMSFGQQQRLPVRPDAHRQIGTVAGIPAKYYDRMLAGDPELLALNVNTWLGRMSDKRMVRTLDGNMRALLSDRYARIDNADVAEAIMPVLMETKGLRIASCEVTDRRLYIKAVDETVRGEAKLNDIVEAGVLITNSETGFGALSVTPMVHRLVCLNGMVLPDQKYRRNHIGSRADIGNAAYAMLSDEAIRADDQAILLKARDIVRGALDAARFAENLEQMKAAASSEKMVDPAATVERLADRVGLMDGERPSVLRHLIEGGDLTKWGALNAVTRAAQDVESYDRSTEIEAMGGAILNLPRSEWRQLADTVA